MDAKTLFANIVGLGGQDVPVVVRDGASQVLLTSDLQFSKVRLGHAGLGLFVDISLLSDIEIEKRGIEDLGDTVVIVGRNGHSPLEPGSIDDCCGEEIV